MAYNYFLYKLLFYLISTFGLCIDLWGKDVFGNNIMTFLGVADTKQQHNGHASTCRFKTSKKDEMCCNKPLKCMDIYV